MKFYFDLLSQPSRALYIFFKINKLPFDAVTVKIGRAEHLSKKFKEINRFQKVPCIVDGDFKLSESVAILRYVVASHPNLVADHWYPSNIQERARVDEYLEWHHNETRIGCAGFFRAWWADPLLRGKSSQKALVATKLKMENSLDLIENIWLADPNKKFLSTDKISFADIHCACELEETRIADYDPFAGRPRMLKWHQHVKEETNPIYDQAHQVAYNLIGTQNKSRFHKAWKLFFSYNY